jgi:transposase-like protein
MAEDVLAILSRITTVCEMTQAFCDEDHCRRLLEAMVWPRGRICPACGYKRSTSIPGRDWGKTKRPGLYQCSNGSCHHQFTVTTRTPLHSTKLPLRLWLQGLWLILQSDKGLSSVRLAETLGISQQAAWRMGHALRLLMTNDKPLEGTVEIDELRIGGRPHKPAGDLGPGRSWPRTILAQDQAVAVGGKQGRPRRPYWHWFKDLRIVISEPRPALCGPPWWMMHPWPKPSAS